MTQAVLPTVSVVVVNYRRAADTITCLRALCDELDYPADRLQLICVDNASGDGSAEQIAEAVARAEVLEANENLGFAAGCNLGVEHASGEIIALLNSDARPHPAWVSEAVEVFKTHPSIAAVASKVLDWDGKQIDYAGSALAWFGMGFKPGYTHPDDGRFDAPCDVLFATGAAMFIRADVYRALGGFDERLFMFYEDVDLGWRLNLRGYRVRYQPTSVAYHRHHASVAGSGQFREYYLLERNALILLYKNLEQSTLDKVLPAALALAIRRGDARGEIDPTEFELTRRGDGDDEPAMTVPKTTMASVLAVDRFVELLPQLQKAREVEQAARVRTDSALRPLLGNANEPLLDHPHYLHAHRVITEAFGIEAALTRRHRVLVVTGDAVSDRMAGPAIRAWNIARVLSAEHDVRLVSTIGAVASEGRVGPPSQQPADTPFEIIAVHQRELPAHVAWAEIVIMQGWVLEKVPALKADTETILVCDLYDPMHFELLAQDRDLDEVTRSQFVTATVHTLSAQLKRGDFLLCASERQRHLWLGHLSALGRLTPELYDADPSARSLLSVVPFGLPDEPPRRTGPGPRRIIDGIGDSDKIVLWAGGVYSWFDPLTLVQAVHRLVERHDDLRLIFQGMRHPNPEITAAGMARDLRALSASLGLTDKHVFFNEGWVPYNQRHNWLLDADCGVTTHYEHVETTFAFRTRVLDYLWAGLPIVSTDGDAFAELVRTERLGVVVPPEDPDALADALAMVLYDAQFAADCRARIERIRDQFSWPAVLEPLVRFCRDPRPAADRLPSATARQRGPSRPVGERLRADLNLVRQYFADGGAFEVSRRAAGRVRRVARERWQR